jgi:hypothetical protein
MSIINDALKKAGKDRQLFQNKPQQIFGKIGKPKTKAGGRMLKNRIFWTIGLGLICLLGLFLAASLKNSGKSMVAQEVIPVAEVSSVAFPMRGIDLEEISVETPSFNLSGILYDQQKPLAIINGSVMEEGSAIEEAQLLKIHSDYVLLSLEGKEFTLRTGNTY